MTQTIEVNGGETVQMEASLRTPLNHCTIELNEPSHVPSSAIPAAAAATTPSSAVRVHRVRITREERLRLLEEEFIRNLPSPDPQLPCAWSPRIRWCTFLVMAFIAYTACQAFILEIWSVLVEPYLHKLMDSLIPRAIGFLVMHEILRMVVYGNHVRRLYTGIWMIGSVILAFQLVYLISGINTSGTEVDFLFPIIVILFVHRSFYPSTWRWITKKTGINLTFHTSTTPGSLEGHPDEFPPESLCLPWTRRHWILLAAGFSLISVWIQFGLPNISVGNFRRIRDTRHTLL